ncbi:MAG TPA: PBP1A family penicillin-binding protein [Gemmatimonadaceae bacterium]|nr:PBP1A family penicillin-binding protein [Gemmatimonadaceae bacterium]
MRIKFPTLSHRAKLSILIGAGVLAAVIVGSMSWYGYRVYTELTPASWRAPTQIVDRNGNTLVALYGADWQVAEPVTLKDLPEFIPNAFLAAEDTRFRHHIGIDPIGIGRALLSNVKAGGVAEGGSTITQQVAKMRFLSAKRTLSRKLAEIPLAVMIEVRLSKDDILEAYLNEVYLGHRDGREVRGLGEAARVYFGKTPQQLTVAEAALISGMIRAPNRDNPDERSRIATQRRNAVLDVMLDKKWISKEQRDVAVASDAEFRPGKRRLRPYPYLIAAIREEFIDKLGERALRTGGIKIYTPVDRQMQNAAQIAVAGGTLNLRKAHGWLQRRKPLQGALLSVEPKTGGIRALVGGSNFSTSQYDRTRLMRRQLGSAAKPFTYAAAIASRGVTPSTVVEDQPVTIQLASNRTWQPKNYDQQFRGPVTVRQAFEQSLNVPAVRVAQQVGVDRVREVWHEAGFTGDLSETPAIALGVDDVSMRDVVAAYSIFPNLGVRSEPHVIERVEKQTGGELYKYEGEQAPAIDAAVAYVIHSLMRGVVLRGTAARLTGMGMDYLAGKTGTTSNYRDAWFVGYAPDLLTAVWVGFDDGTPLRMSSGEAAVPIFGTYMQRAAHSHDELQPPPGISLVEVEAMSGRRWGPGCGESVTEVFLKGTEPAEQCGGAFTGSMAMGGYEEPPMITEEQAAALEAMAQDMAMRQSEIVHDPDSVDISSDEDTGNARSDDPVRESRPVPQSMPFPVRPPPERRRAEPRVIPLPPPPPPETDTGTIPPAPPPPAPIPRDSLEAILSAG